MARMLMSHLNTLVFSLFVMGIAVAIIFIMLSRNLQYFFVFFLTLDIGLLIVVLAALAKLINDDATKDKENKDANSKTRVVTCPDYYGYTMQPDGSYKCKSEVKLHNPIRNTNTIFKLTGSPDCKTLPAEIDLGALRGKDLMTICRYISGLDPETGKKENMNADWASIKHVPWTAIRPFCVNATAYPS